MHPGLRPKVTWWGPFCFEDNLLFYFALVGSLFGIAVSSWLWLLALPFFVRLVIYANPGQISITGVLAVFPKLLFLTARQAVICASLIFGSIRDRCLVL
jgi:hypothetical protein